MSIDIGLADSLHTQCNVIGKNPFQLLIQHPSNEIAKRESSVETYN